MASDVLQRRYSRLLMAYPRWHRRERGLEMLTTMLDAAEPGRRRPAVADAMDIIRGGLRCRFRPPRGFRPRAATVIVVLFAALAGSTIAARWAASILAPTPTESQAATAAGVALGKAPRNVPGPVETCPYYCFHEWVDGGDQIVTFDVPFDENSGVDYVTVVSWEPYGEEAPVTDGARARLAAAGWVLGDLTVQGNGTRYFTATQGGLSLYMIAAREVSIPTVIMQVEHRIPVAVPLAAGIGLPIGALIGWLLAVWILQRRRRQQPVVRAVSGVWGLLTLMIMGAVVTQNLQLFGFALLSRGGGEATATNVALLPASGVSALLFTPVLTVILAVVVLVNLPLAALPTRALPIDVTPAVSPGP
jgi:hypothetical protein